MTFPHARFNLVIVTRNIRDFMADGLKAAVAAQEFLEHATQDAAHADDMADLLKDL